MMALLEDVFDKLIAYDGSSPWQMYIFEFESVAKELQWSEEDKLDYLIIALEDEAAEYACCCLNEKARENYETLQAAMASRFNDPNFPANMAREENKPASPRVEESSWEEIAEESREEIAEEPLRVEELSREEIAEESWEEIEEVPPIVEELSRDEIAEESREEIVEEPLRVKESRREDEIPITTTSVQLPTTTMVTQRAVTPLDISPDMSTPCPTGFAKSPVETTGVTREAIQVPGHDQTSCLNDQTIEKRRCFHCDGIGHLARNCFVGELGRKSPRQLQLNSGVHSNSVDLLVSVCKGAEVTVNSEDKIGEMSPQRPQIQQRSTENQQTLFGPNPQKMGVSNVKLETANNERNKGYYLMFPHVVENSVTGNDRQGPNNSQVTRVTAENNSPVRCLSPQTKIRKMDNPSGNSPGPPYRPAVKYTTTKGGLRETGIVFRLPEWFWGKEVTKIPGGCLHSADEVRVY